MSGVFIMSRKSGKNVKSLRLMPDEDENNNIEYVTEQKQVLSLK